MSAEYVGVYYPFIGYLKEKQMEQLGKTKSKEKKDLKNF